MMKKILLPFLLLSLGATAQVCNPSGNIVIFSNYDGGTLNINVDVNIPNLKIGVVSYEAVDVVFSGTYVGNITGVEYAGYNSAPSSHCSPGVATTNFSGVPVGVTPNILLYPPVTYADPDGYSYIICAYTCASGSMGGCNTPEQVYAYFESVFSGTVYSHKTQYGCWSGTQNISDGGNCCSAPPASPVANFSMSADSICVGECINFTDLSTNTPTGWSWSFSGAATTSSTSQNPTGICYNAAGSYSVILTATNAVGSDMVTLPVVVTSVNTATTSSGITITASATGASYQWINCATNAPVAGATNASFTASANGSYAVIVTQNGCTDTSSCTTISTVGITSIPVNELVRVFPNPSTGIITIEDQQGLLKNQTVSITNMLGETILTANMQNTKTTLDLSKVQNGTYFVTVGSSFGKLVTRFVKE